MIFDDLRLFATVESTMDVARGRFIDGRARAGAAILADFQTGGRGRQGRSWFAPRGANACMTAIGAPVPASDAWKVALFAGIATAEALASTTQLPTKVRFPNDIYLDGQKLGGILVETVPGAAPGWVTPLIGIGVNVNIAPEDFPEELRDRATSVLCATGSEFRVGPLSGFILARLGDIWDDFVSGPFGETILPRWFARADPESRRIFRIDGVNKLCRVVDISDAGIVTLESADGTEHSIHAAHVILGDD